MKERRPAVRALVPATSARRFVVPLVATAVVAVALAGCGADPVALGSKRASVDPKLGVSPSPRVVAMGEKVPKGGGRAMVGKPYNVAGKRYVPKLDPNYSKVGLASWYGNAFHGRKTANGEVFDSESLSAAHPTMPLPSYARVTSVETGRSVLVRVNDRGPFHSNRLIDISRRTADVLGVRTAGIAKVKVEYVGPAPVAGHDEDYLMASYRGPGEARPSLPETLIASAEALPGVAARAGSSVANAGSTVASAAAGLVTGSKAATVDAVDPETRPIGPKVPGNILPPVRPLLAGEAYVMVASIDPAESFLGASTQVAALDLPAVTPVGYSAPQSIDDLIVLPPEPPVRRSYAAERIDDAYAAVDGMGQGVALTDLASRLAERAAAPKPAAAAGSELLLQAGVFADRDNADRLAKALSGIGRVDVLDIRLGDRTLSQVKVSALTVTADEAVQAAERAGARGAVILRR